MSNIQEVALKRAIAMLEGMKCSYAIIDPMGNKHGLLDVKEPTVRSGIRKHPHGERANYVRTYTSAMAIGSVVEVPFGKYDALDIQSSSTSAAHKMWGKGSVTTTINRPRGVLEIMRIL
ncbi:MAG: hypothetical protein ACOYNN_13275 [Terrimicrobiaceae bacterium]